MICRQPHAISCSATRTANGAADCAGNQPHLEAVAAQAKHCRVKTGPSRAGRRPKVRPCDIRKFAVEVEHTASRYCPLLSAHHGCRPFQQVLRAEDGWLAGWVVQDGQFSVRHGRTPWHFALQAAGFPSVVSSLRLRCEAWRTAFLERLTTGKSSRISRRITFAKLGRAM